MTQAPDLTVDTPAWPDDAIEVGRVLDAWGIKGWMKILSHSPDAQALFASRRWFLQPSEKALPGKPHVVPPVLKILSVRDHADGIVAQAEGVSDRNGAEALKGARIFVSRSTFPEPDADEHYWIDLIGMSVVNKDGTVLGEVIDLLDTGPHCVLRILPAGRTAPVKPDEEILIPFVNAFVGDVDKVARVIPVDWDTDY
ncbi:ribosome maturation factor RimM [Roseateles aquatilis]|uniref:Ribosome maturation factor RimM n=1 Tax=Roseateles aquatilis TaxID=431061 RepID=A0A246J8D0_9BURK|nr:ribosome maturation factor RimM [Roseateles aquatilis]OWQ88759.1 ribosome maturation factor RimM [Roseateles aquatilis]